MWDVSTLFFLSGKKMIDLWSSIFEWVQFNVDKGEYWAYYSIVIVIVSQGKANYFGTRQLLVDSNDCVQFYSCFFKPNKTKSHMGKNMEQLDFDGKDRQEVEFIYTIMLSNQIWSRKTWTWVIMKGQTGNKETAESRELKRWRKQCVALRKDSRSQTNKRGSPTNTAVRRKEKERKKPNTLLLQSPSLSPILSPGRPQQSGDPTPCFIAQRDQA